MLAELHGKLDPERVDAVERTEDLLTDAVFGSIRHLPPVGVLGPLLQRIGVTPSRSDLQRADVRLWPAVPMALWPGAFIEPDVIVVAGRHVVVFEAKLHSGFGRYPDPSPGSELIHHQLAVQYAAVERWAAGERLFPPVVVAVTPSPQRPEADFAVASISLQALCPDVAASEVLKWISWRTVGEVLDGADGLRVHERRLVDDVLAFMDRRGVRRMFTGFNPEDYWLMSAAQRVAHERLYPEIRTFVEDLAGVLAEDGVTWSQPGNRAIWTNYGSSVSKPGDWVRSFLGVQFWPSGWPDRQTKPGLNTALYAIFDFIDPALEVGLSIACPGLAVAQETWSPSIEAVAQEFNTMLPSDVEVVLDSGDVARPVRLARADVVDVAWFESVLASATTTAHLRLRSRTDPLSLTVQDARERLISMRDLVSSCSELWAMLRSAGYVAAQDPSSSGP